MDTTNLETEPTPKPKRGRPPRKPTESKPPPPKVKLAGITTVLCPAECTVDRCVITERNICGHPHKGNQINQMNRVEVRNYKEAKAMLERQNTEKKLKA